MIIYHHFIILHVIFDIDRSAWPGRFTSDLPHSHPHADYCAPPHPFSSSCVTSHVNKKSQVEGYEYCACPSIIGIPSGKNSWLRASTEDLVSQFDEKVKRSDVTLRTQTHTNAHPRTVPTSPTGSFHCTGKVYKTKQHRAIFG